MTTFKEVRISPEVLQYYGDMTKNEIVLHLAIKALSEEGKVKRNINHIATTLGKCPKRLRDAEKRLKQRGLLRIHLKSGKRFWYVYNQPTGQTSPAETTKLHTPITQSAKTNLWHTIRQTISNWFPSARGENI